MTDNQIVNIEGRGSIIKDSIGFIGLLSILACTYPFVFQAFLPLPSIATLIPFTVVIYLVVVKKKSYILRHPITSIAILQIVSTCLTFIYSVDSEYIKQVMYIVWAICFLSLIHYYGIKKFLFFFNRMILIIALLGTLSFFLSIIFNNNVLFEFTNGDGRPAGLVYLTFSNSVYDHFVRYGGVFDEPGAMAFWGFFSLITNKLYVKDKKLEIPLIISLSFTFSLAYFIQIFLYFFFFYVLDNFSFKRLFFVSIILVGLILYILAQDSSSFIYQATLARIGIGNSVDFMSDNNRVPYMEKSILLFKQSPFLGVGPTVVNNQGAFDNPYETLGRDGFIGALFIYLPLLMSVFYTKYNRQILFASIIIFVGYLQRPFHFQFLHYTMLYLFFYISCSMKSSKE